MCRHRDEFARDFEIELLSLLEIRKVLVQDQRDGNVLDLYFIFRQQEENEVERPFKVLQRLRAALMHHALQLENGIVHDIPLTLSIYDPVDQKLVHAVDALAEDIVSHAEPDEHKKNKHAVFFIPHQRHVRAVGQKGEEHLRPVERRDRDEVEKPQTNAHVRRHRKEI